MQVAGLAFRCCFIRNGIVNIHTILYAILVYTTPVNSAFRAIWLVPLSRDIKYYSPPGGFRRKKMAREPHFVVKYSSYLGTAIKLVLYILKQLFASVSVTSGGYLPRRSGSVNIHRYSPPLRRIIVNYCWIPNKPVLSWAWAACMSCNFLPSASATTPCLVHSKVHGPFHCMTRKHEPTVKITISIGNVLENIKWSAHQDCRMLFVNNIEITTPGK